MKTLMDKKSALKAKRAHILAAALACFLEKGFNQTGIRDIAKRAQISLGNLYNHFPSKKAVLIEIASQEREEIADFVACLSDHSAPEATLRRFIADYTDYCDDPDYATLFYEIVGEAMRDREIADLFMANHQTLVVALAALLEAGQKQGVFTPQEDNREIADIVLDALESYATRKALDMRVPASGSRIVHDFVLSRLIAPTG